MEQPFPTINALPKSFFSPTETCILNGHGYILNKQEEMTLLYPCAVEMHELVQ